MDLSSPSFEGGKPIPAKFTCEGSDVSPALEWSAPPEGTKSLALIVDDPDAPDPQRPERTFVHWVVFNISPDVRRLEEGAGSGGALPRGARAGKNGWDRPRYGGPCPPKGRHRYFHKLYALDTAIDLIEPSKDELERAMAGHVLEQVEMVGTYQRGT